MTAQPSDPAPGLAVPRVAGVQLRGRAGPLPARAYWPRSAPPGPDAGAGAGAGPRPPLLVLLPGDGTAPHGLDGADHLARVLCSAAGVVVLAATYRPPAAGSYAASLEDAATATWWAADHAAELGADPERLVVAGEGAGAVLAAAMARRARDEGWPPIRRHIRIRPGLGAADLDQLACSLRLDLDTSPPADAPR